MLDHKFWWSYTTYINDNPKPIRKHDLITPHLVWTKFHDLIWCNIIKHTHITDDTYTSSFLLLCCIWYILHSTINLPFSYFCLCKWSRSWMEWLFYCTRLIWVQNEWDTWCDFFNSKINITQDTVAGKFQVLNVFKSAYNLNKNRQMQRKASFISVL